MPIGETRRKVDVKIIYMKNAENRSWAMFALITNDGEIQTQEYVTTLIPLPTRCLWCQQQLVPITKQEAHLLVGPGKMLHH